MSAQQDRKPTLAVVGATGAVGTVMLEHPLHPRGRLGRDPAGRLAALGRHGSCRCAARRSTVAGAERRRSSTASTWRCSTCPTRCPPSGRRSPPPAARSSSTTPAPSGWTPTCRWSCPRSTREQARNRPRGIIANPNCTTLSMIVALGALHREYGLRELVVASYQAASGAGQAGIDTLHDQIAKVAGDRTLGHRARRRAPGGRRRPRPVPGAAGAQRGAVGRLARRTAAGRREELKVRNESRKILGLPDLQGRPRPAYGCRWSPPTRSPCTRSSAPRSTPTSAREVLRDAPGVVAGRRPGRRRVPDADRRRSAPTRPGSAGSAGRWTTRTRSTCSSAATTCARAPRSTPPRSPSWSPPSSRA